MDRKSQVATALLIAFILVLLGMIAWAMRSARFSASMRSMVEDAWGLVTLADLYVGLLISGIWIALLERRWWPTVGWFVGLMCLGNLVTAVYFLQRMLRARALSAAFLSPSARDR